LIHGYDIIDQAKVWQVITQDLPELKNQVTELLQEYVAGEADGEEKK